MSNVIWGRVAAASGMLFAVLAIVSIQLSLGTGDTVTPASSAGQVAIEFNARQDDFRLSAYLMAGAVFFLLWFLPALRARLEASLESDSWLPQVVLASGLAIAATLVLLANLGFAAALIADFEGEWEVAKTLLVLSWNHFLVLAPSIAAFVTAVSAITVQSSKLPTWFGWASPVVVLAPAFYSTALMTMLFLIWVLGIASVLFYKTFSEESGYLK